jgi:hypothetical protein
MHSKLLEITARSFSPMPIPGLSNKAQRVVNAALDAMSTWRNEIADASEKSGAEVVQKMAAAAKALGWPEQVVDTVRVQIQSATQIQIKTMDQIMDVWEEQLTLPDPTTAPTSDMLAKLKSPGGSWPSGGGFDAMNPMQAWLQFLEQWQKHWSEAMTTWVTTVRQ